jgi:predicted CopG family antitoxin
MGQLGEHVPDGIPGWPEDLAFTGILHGGRGPLPGDGPIAARVAERESRRRPGDGHGFGPFDVIISEAPAGSVKYSVYIYMYMGTKTISLKEEAYRRLRALKRRGESFSDVVLRLTARRPLSDFAGTLGEEAGRALAEAIEAARRERARLDVER